MNESQKHTLLGGVILVMGIIFFATIGPMVLTIYYAYRWVKENV